jgi:hypothetical protein
VELADTEVSKASAIKSMRVQFPPDPPKIKKILMHQLSINYFNKYKRYKMATDVDTEEDKLAVIKEIQNNSSKLLELLRAMLPEIDKFMIEKPPLALEAAETAYMLAVCLDVYMNDDFKIGKEVEPGK